MRDLRARCQRVAESAPARSAHVAQVSGRMVPPTPCLVTRVWGQALSRENNPINRTLGGRGMSKSRMLIAAAVAALSVMLIGGAGPAAAQSSTPFTKTVKMTGKAKNGKKFNGTYTIERFTRRGNAQYAVGTVKGRFKGRNVTRRNVRVPVGDPAGADRRRLAAAPAHAARPDPGRLPGPQSEPAADRPEPARPARRHEPDRGAGRGRPRRGEPARQPAVRGHRPARPAGPDAGFGSSRSSSTRCSRWCPAPRRAHARSGPPRPCGGAGPLSSPAVRHLLRHPADRAQAPRQLHRRHHAVRGRPGSRRPGDLLHRRPALDHGRVRRRGAARSSRTTWRPCLSPPGSTPSAASCSASPT